MILPEDVELISAHLKQRMAELFNSKQLGVDQKDDNKFYWPFFEAALECMCRLSKKINMNAAWCDAMKNIIGEYSKFGEKFVESGKKKR